MSSQFPCTPELCYHGSYAVDGVIDTEAGGNLASTLVEYSPYLQIDLEESYCVKGVKYYNGIGRGIK